MSQAISDLPKAASTYCVGLHDRYESLAVESLHWAVSMTVLCTDARCEVCDRSRKAVLVVPTHEMPAVSIPSRVVVRFCQGTSTAKRHIQLCFGLEQRLH